MSKIKASRLEGAGNQRRRQSDLLVLESVNNISLSGTFNLGSVTLKRAAN